MVEVSAEEEEESAQNHKRREERFSPMLHKKVNSLCLGTHDKWDTEEDVCEQFAEYEHTAGDEYASFVLHLTVNIPDGGNGGEECAGVKNHKKAEQKGGKKSCHCAQRG